MPGVDFLRLDDTHFSEEERMVRDSMREWVSKEFMPHLQEHVRQDGSFPMELVPQMAELGMFGANLQGYGCAGSAVWLDGDAEAGIALLTPLVAALRASGLLVALPVVS